MNSLEISSKIKLSFVNFIIALLCLIPTICYAGDGLRLKVDSVTLNSPVSSGTGVGTPTNVGFVNSYTNPVVFVLSTSQNPDPSSVRISNVTPTGFDAAVIEPPGGSGGVSATDLEYLIVEAGLYDLGGGILMEVGNATTNPILNTTSFQGRNAAGTQSWEVFNFVQPFTTAPAVITQVQTYNNGGTLDPLNPSAQLLETAVRNVNANTMQFALERGETNGGVLTQPEEIGYMAITSNQVGSFTGASGAVNFETMRTPRSITGACTNFTFSTTLGTSPIVVVSQNSRFGGDGGWMQRCASTATQVGFEVDEDITGDPDRNHTTEIAGVFLFSGPFSAVINGLGIEAGAVTTPAQSLNTLNFTPVNFPNPFASDSVVVLPMATLEGAEPASVRIRNVDRNGFEIAQVQPQGETGAADSMTVDYIAVEEGVHTLPNGVVMEAGIFNTAQVVSRVSPNTFTTLNFNNTFTAPPVFLAQIQSVNSEPSIDPTVASSPWLTVGVDTDSVTNTSVDIGLEQAQTTLGTVVSEEVGYLAITPSVHEDFIDDSGNLVEYESLITPLNIAGSPNLGNCFQNNFATPFTSGSVLAVAGARSREGIDGFWLRRCALNNTSIGLLSDEDQALDEERDHANESASVLAFSRPFESCLVATLAAEKTARTDSDPVNVTTNPKAITGSVIEYEIEVTNTTVGSTTNNTLVINDELPEGTSFFVGDGTVSPFTIVNNTNTGAGNTLVFGTYGGFADNTDSFSFSNNNGLNYNYSPTDPDGDGFDPNVTNFRLTPTGIMTGASSTLSPEINISYQVRID